MKLLTKSLMAGLFVVALPVYAADPAKEPLIEHQEKSAEAAKNDAKAATPKQENRPAATVKQHSNDSKEKLIEHQQENARKAAKDAKAATPIEENRPAATVKQPSQDSK
jgi:hypothetical protein